MDNKIAPGPGQQRLSKDFLAYCSHALDRLACGEYQQLDLEAHSFHDAAELRLVSNLKQLQQRFKHLDFTLEQLAMGCYSIAPFMQPDTDPVAESLKAVIQSHAQLVKQAGNLIEGDFSEVTYSRAEGDQLGECLQKLLANFQYINWRVKMVAEGDCSARIAPLSERDELGKGLDDLTRSLRDVTQVAEAVASGDLSRKVEIKGDDDHLGQSINRMIDGLNRLNDENTYQQWFKTTLNQLSDELRGEINLADMLETVLAFLAHNLDFELGTCYLYDEERDLLELKASHAFRRRQADVLTLQPGEGLVGQAAREQQAVIYNALPEGYLSLGSSLGETGVSAVLVAPLRLNGELKGVIELGSVHPIRDRQLEFIEACREHIAIAINSAQVHWQLEQLLEQTEKQRSELESKTRVLQENEDKLRVQQEQLAQTNEELRVKTEQTEQANEELRVKSAQTEQANEELRVQSDELEEVNRKLKEKSDHLAEHQEQLERHNRELTLARDELEKKAEQLAQSSRYKTEFLANMSHELRTPLNSLMILAKMLADNGEGNLSEDQVESAGVILSSGRDLMTLINEILDLSKVEAGKMEVHRDPVNLATLVADLEHQFRPMASDHNISFSCQIEESVPAQFIVDNQRIKQILRNLIGNAIKFTIEGSVQLLIRRRQAADSRLQKDTIEFEVRDTGIGIPEDKLNFVFEAFQQVDGSTSREFGGTGLGLTICRELSGLLQGNVHVESEVDRGSSFFLQLPLDVGEADTRTNLEATAELLTFSTRDTGQLTEFAPQARQSSLRDDRNSVGDTDATILVIEDDRSFCQSLMSLARRNGYKCLTALDGQTGIELANRYRPQGILLDLELPDIDGQRVLQYLKDSLATRDIPVHILTAKDRSSADTLSAAVGYLTKPLSEEDVLAAFKRLEAVNQRQLKHLLLVEDDDNNARAIRQLLEGSSVSVDVAGDSAAALTQLAAQQYDCMVLDLTLPDSDGASLLQQIDHDAGITLPAVIVYTGRDLSREEHQELSRYANAIVLKGSNSTERLLDEVSMFLDRVETQPDDSPQAAPAAIDEQVLEGKRVLLADDDMRNIFAMSKVLKAKGMQVDIAENGRVALERVQGRPDYDLILMDIMMPEMDGFEATRAIRALPGWAERPIIALTAKAMPEDRGKCLDAGASDYISKPVDTAVLISMMRVWLSQSQVEER